MDTPRATARSQSSSTRIAAPSPNTSPLRLAEKGLQEAEGSLGSSLARVCNASQAFSAPNDSGASEPPVMARSISPRRTRSDASPIETADEEQAVEEVRFGPLKSYSIPIQAAGALVMPMRMENGFMRSQPSR